MACRHLLSSSQGFLAETGAAPALRGEQGARERRARGGRRELRSWRMSARGHHGGESPALRSTRYFRNRRLVQRPTVRCLLLLVVAGREPDRNQVRQTDRGFVCLGRWLMLEGECR